MIAKCNKGEMDFQEVRTSTKYHRQIDRQRCMHNNYIPWANKTEGLQVDYGVMGMQFQD